MTRHLTAALFAGALLIPAGAANALSCLPGKEPAEAIHEVDALFTGTVVEIDRAQNRYVFEVADDHLGNLDDRVAVYTGSSHWAWEYELGATHTVAARIRKTGYLRAGPCPLVKDGPQRLVDWLQDNPDPRPGVGISQPHP